MLRCSLAASTFSFSCDHFFWLHTENFLTCLIILLAKDVWILLWLVSSSASNPNIFFWWFFVEQLESRQTDPGFRQWLVSMYVPIIIDGSPLEEHKCLFSFISGHQCNFRGIGKSSFGTYTFCSSSNMNPIYTCVITHNAPEILSSFDISISISGFFFSFSRILQRFLREVAHRFVKAVDNAYPRKISPVLHVHTSSSFLLRICTFFIRIFLQEFSDGEIVRRSSFPLSKDHQSNFHPHSRRTNEFSRKDFWAELMHSTLGLLMVLDWI